MKNILIVAAAQTVLIILTVAGTWFMFLNTYPVSPGADGAQATEEEAPEVKADPIYVSIDPALVVNLQSAGKMRFLQLQLEVMTRDEEVAELLEKHASRIRNDLIIQLGSLTIDELRAPDGKQKIQENARVAINTVLSEEERKDEAIEAVYFTKFVIQ